MSELSYKYGKLKKMDKPVHTVITTESNDIFIVHFKILITVFVIIESLVNGKSLFEFCYWLEWVIFYDTQINSRKDNREEFYRIITKYFRQ